MITISEFICKGNIEGETLVDTHHGLYPNENDMVENFCRKHNLSKSAVPRYFCTLGVQTHRRRSRMKKEYGEDAER